MLDRSKCVFWWVWNGNKENPKDSKRIVIEKLYNGSCMAVLDGDERDFNMGNVFKIVCWDHCEEIQEPKKRNINVDKGKVVIDGDNMRISIVSADFLDDYSNDKNCWKCQRGTVLKSDNYCSECGRKLEVEE